MTGAASLGGASFEQTPSPLTDASCEEVQRQHEEDVHQEPMEIQNILFRTVA